MGSDPPQSQRQSITQAGTECQIPGHGQADGTWHNEGVAHRTMMEVEERGLIVQVHGLDLAEGE